MNTYHRRKIAILALCIFSIFSKLSTSQTFLPTSMGEVSEIIIPSTKKLQNTNSLYYEVHLLREDFPSPSFWYKIIFKEDCFYEFSLFPVMEGDGYDFYFFRVPNNLDFCKAVKEDKLISCNAARIYKQYNVTEPTESKLVNIKALPVKAGDAIYIEVFSTVGNDCGHILDFQTSSTSFVFKVVNDKCAGAKNLDPNFFQAKYKPVFTEKEAIRIFSNTVCHLSNNPVLVTSIKANPKSVTIQKKLDYAAYSESEASKSLPPKTDSVIKTPELIPPEVIYPKDIAVVDTQTVELKAVAPAETQKAVSVVKSTADLNAQENKEAQIKHDMVAIKSGKEKNSTRLDVDFVLFTLLKEDLKRKTEYNREQLKEYNFMYKNNTDKEKRADIAASIKEIKEQKVELLNKTKDTKIKLKRIQKRLNENRRKPVETGESVFTKSVYPEDEKKPSSTISSAIVYKIQIGVYKNPISLEVFKGLSPVFSEAFPGGVKYFAGAFTVYKDAYNAKEYIKSMGLTDAFVVAYSDGKRVSVEDARRHEND